MKMTTKLTILLMCLGFAGYWYYYESQPKVWGDNPDEPFIAITGKKPKDVSIDVWAIWGASGPDCKAKTWSADSGWSDGANVKWHITHDFSTDPNRYELRIPFQQYHDSMDCNVVLGDITVQAYNAFDTVGFAQLRIYPSGTNYYDKPIDLTSKIESKDCNSYIFKGLGNVWSGALGCYLFVNEQKKSKKPNYNAETVHFDFSQFTTDTVIHYDILAGDDYRSEPLDPQTGK